MGRVTPAGSHTSCPAVLHSVTEDRHEGAVVAAALRSGSSVRECWLSESLGAKTFRRDEGLGTANARVGWSRQPQRAVRHTGHVSAGRCSELLSTLARAAGGRRDAARQL